MTMQKLGQTYDQKYGGETIKSSKNKVSYPYLSIDKIKAPGIQVGETIVAKVKLRLKRVSEESDESGERCSCSFDVLAIDLPNKSQDGVEYSVNQERTRRKS